MKFNQQHISHPNLFLQVYGGEKFYFLSWDLTVNNRFYLRLDNLLYYTEEEFNCLCPGPKYLVSKAELHNVDGKLKLFDGGILVLPLRDPNKVFQFSQGITFNVASSMKLTPLPKSLKYITVEIT